ncbi:MAG: hypothetical protein U1D30_05420 [Planctomycetota bacterium]
MPYGFQSFHVAFLSTSNSPSIQRLISKSSGSTDAPVDEVFGGDDADWIILDAGHDNATELEPEDLVLDIGPFPAT